MHGLGNQELDAEVEEARAAAAEHSVQMREELKTLLKNENKSWNERVVKAGQQGRDQVSIVTKRYSRVSDPIKGGLIPPMADRVQLRDPDHT